MSDFDLVNFMMINDVGRSTKNNEKLNDLRDKATFIAKKTGQEPESWYEFQQTAPKEESHPVRNTLVGAAIGMALGILGGPAAAISLGFLGGAVGAFHDTENKRRNELVGKYDDYLQKFEQSAVLGRAPAIDRMPPLREGDNVAKLKEQEQMMAQMAGGMIMMK